MACHTGFNERLIKTSARGAREHIHRGFNSIVVRGDRRRDAVPHGNQLAFAGAADFKVPGAVRNGFHRPFRRQHARRARNLPEGFRNPGEDLRFVKLTRHRQHRVIGLIPLMVEGLKVFDGDVLDIASCPDRIASVGVPIKENALHALYHHAHGLIFPHLVFVSHHRHFGVKILFGDVGIHHGVRAPAERPAHVVVVRGEAYEVIRAVKPRGAVHAEAALREFARGIGIILASLEHQVFQKVRHPGFAVVFLTRPHEVRGVHGGRGFALIRKKNDFEAVLEFVTLNPFHNVLRLRQCRRGGHRRAGNCRHNEFLQSFFKHSPSLNFRRPLR